jgi:hypothetical protein
MKRDVVKLLQDKADQVQRGAEILLAKTRDWQVIKAYINNRLEEITLTPEQQKKFDRYQYIYNQLVSGKYTEHDVIEQIKTIHKVGITQAYEDVRCTRELFCSVVNINKRFEQKMELESARNLKRKCEELQDYRSAAAIQKNIVQLLRDIPDEEENPGELFEGHTYELTFNPTLLGAPAIDMKEVLRVVNEKRHKKINIDMFDEIPFVECKPE